MSHETQQPENSKQPEDSKPLVLVVNHNRRNLELMTQLLTQVLERRGYQVLATVSLEAVDQALSRPHTIKLALIDISGFDAGVWGFCQRLRQQKIPFLVISPQQQAAIQQASALSGAIRCLTKPLIMKELLQLVWNLLGGAD
jgi:DNA-binding response OmpR family regulator